MLELLKDMMARAAINYASKAFKSLCRQLLQKTLKRTRRVRKKKHKQLTK